MVELRNHTPHPVEIRVDGRVPVVLEPHTPLPRLVVTRRDAGVLDTPWGPIPMTVTDSVGAVDDLPDPQPGVYLIVARSVADAATDRADLVFPDDLVRDEHGRVVACRALGTSC